MVIALHSYLALALLVSIGRIAEVSATLDGVSGQLLFNTLHISLQVLYTPSDSV